MTPPITLTERLYLLLLSCGAFTFGLLLGIGFR